MPRHRIRQFGWMIFALVAMLGAGPTGWMVGHVVTAHGHEAHAEVAHVCGHPEHDHSHDDSEAPSDSDPHDCPLCHLIASAAATIELPAQPTSALTAIPVDRPIVDRPVLESHLPHLGARAPPVG